MDFNNAPFKLLVFVVCYTLVQGQDFCNTTEVPSIRMCQTASRTVAADTFVYLDTGGAPIVTRVECNCSIGISGSGRLNLAYRVDQGGNNDCGADFKMNDVTWGCNSTTQLTVPYQRINNLTFTKKFSDPQNWLSCLGIKSVGHSITVECYPYRLYYAPDEDVNGLFSDWTFTSECSVTCGTGTRTRQRRCDNPAPRNNGAECLASDGVTRTLLETETVACETSCSVNGVWGPWTNTSSCSVTCGSGTWTQTRNCNSTAPQNGGEECLKLDGNNDLLETRTISCFETACPGSGSGQTSQTGSSATTQSTSQETPNTQQSVDKEKKEDDSNIGAIIGGTIGGLLFLLLLLLLIICCIRRRRRKDVKRRPSEGPRSVRYLSHGDDVTVTENQLYNYDGENPSHATNALFVGGIPETPQSPGEIPHFQTGTGDRYAVIMDSNRTKPKSKERPNLDTFHSQEDNPKAQTNGDIRASTDTVKLADSYNEDQLGRGVDNPSYENNYIAPYDSAEGEAKAKTSSSSPSPYDYIDNAKLKQDDDAFNNGDLAGDYATLPDDLDKDDDQSEDNERYKRFISSEPEDTTDDGYMKSPKRENTFEFPDTS